MDTSLRIQALRQYMEEQSLDACVLGSPENMQYFSGFQAITYSRPILFVVRDRAHSKFFSENAYAAAKEPKELYTVADAEHIDLYDRLDRIPFDKLAEFFSSNLK